MWRVNGRTPTLTRAQSLCMDLAHGHGGLRMIVLGRSKLSRSGAHRCIRGASKFSLKVHHVHQCQKRSKIRHCLTSSGTFYSEVQRSPYLGHQHHRHRLDRLDTLQPKIPTTPPRRKRTHNQRFRKGSVRISALALARLLNTGNGRRSSRRRTLRNSLEISLSRRRMSNH